MALLPPLDTPTMMVMVAAGTLSMAIAMSVVRPERREGLGLWALALVAHTVTYVLFLLRGQATDWISVVLANTVLALVFALLLGAVAEFHDRAMPRLQMALPIVATAALMALFLKSYQGRLLSSSFMLALQIALILWALWRPTAPAQLRGALLVSVALGAPGWFCWDAGCGTASTARRKAAWLAMARDKASPSSLPSSSCCWPHWASSS